MNDKKYGASIIFTNKITLSDVIITNVSNIIIIIEKIKNIYPNIKNAVTNIITKKIAWIITAKFLDINNRFYK